MDLQLRGWRVLVTGATSGMGRAVVTGLVQEGARVVACARDPAGAGSLPPGTVDSVFVDLTRPKAADQVVAKAVASLGGLDCLIASAGRGMGGAVEKLTDDQWIQGLEINLLSEIRLARASIEHLRERKGRVVFFTAVVGREPRKDHSLSAVSKVGLTALAKSLSKELAADGILVNCLAPGRINGPQIDRMYPDQASRERFCAENIPLGRFGDPAEVVPFVLLLASPLNTYVTGQTIALDGGMARAI